MVTSPKKCVNSHLVNSIADVKHVFTYVTFTPKDNGGMEQIWEYTEYIV